MNIKLRQMLDELDELLNNGDITREERILMSNFITECEDINYG